MTKENDEVVTMDTDLYSMFGTAPGLESEGIWIVYGADKDKDPSFKVARSGGENRKYQTTLVNRARPYQRVLNVQSKDPDDATLKLIEGFTKDAFIEACLKDWRNVKDKAGKPLSFSKENAYILFQELPELFRDLQEQANSIANFRQDQVDAAVKN